MSVIEPAPPLSRRRFWMRTWAQATLASILVGLFVLAVAGDLGREEVVRRDIDRSYAARRELQQLFSFVQDAETAQQGYLLTGDRDFLQRYSSAEEGIPAQEIRVEAALIDSPEQQRRLNLLRGLIDQKVDDLAQTLAIEATRDPVAAKALMATHQSQRLVDQIRAVMDDMNAAEARSLTGLRGQSSDLRLRLCALAGLALGAMLVAIVLMQWRDRRRQIERNLLIAELSGDAIRLSAIFGSAMDGIITLTSQGAVESVNPAAERMFGRPAEALLGRKFSILTDVTPQRFDAFVNRMAKGDPELENGITRNLVAKRSDGSVFPAEVALRGMTLPGGFRLVAVVRDVSERRRAETLKDEFVATVSHELRTPLTSIAGALGLLQAGAGGVLPERAGRLVQIAEANSTRLVRLINNILDMEKFEGRHALLTRSQQDLNDVAGRATEMMAGLAEKRGVHVMAFRSPQAPAALGDADRMLQVLTNLLSNAINFSPPGGEVEMQVSVAGSRGRIAVVDRGAGVPESFRPRLFQKFAQADGADTRGHPGTGLGLAIAREIAELHGGALSFAPTPGGGASFFFDLPLSVVASPAPTSARSLVG